MQILENKYLVLRTRKPERVLTKDVGAKVLCTKDDIYTIRCNWVAQNSVILTDAGVTNVPSPIIRDYTWKGAFAPMRHQIDTASFLSARRRAFCFNEQGTGKTASAIWASDYLMTEGIIRRVLIVCPLSIIQAAWEHDLFQFATHRTVGIAHGNREKRKAVINSDAEYVVINYEGVDIVADDIAKNNFDLIIIDEANAYKTTNTKRWKTMNKLITTQKFVWMMTGTPAAQTPFDAYGLAKLCVPSRVPQFAGRFKESVMVNVGRFKWIARPEASNIVHKVLQPAIRFRKEECLDLPEITYTDRYAPLTPQQTSYYKRIREDFLVQLSSGEEISAANAAVNLNKLLQVSSGAAYSNSGAVVRFDVSNRLNVVKEVIAEASNKVLIFVPFKHAIELLKENLDKAKIPCAIISGEVSMNKRTEIFSRFQNKPDTDLKVLIIQPAAAAHGITLTAANVVVWYAPVTSIETYLQANARIVRKGQRNPMTVVHIRGSRVEERLYKMLQNRLDEHTKLIDLYRDELTL
jgi:SNF2 family DNA or RNA helicase